MPSLQDSVFDCTLGAGVHVAKGPVGVGVTCRERSVCIPRSFHGFDEFGDTYGNRHRCLDAGADCGDYAAF